MTKLSKKDKLFLWLYHWALEKMTNASAEVVVEFCKFVAKFNRAPQNTNIDLTGSELRWAKFALWCMTNLSDDTRYMAATRLVAAAREMEKQKRPNGVNIQ